MLLIFHLLIACFFFFIGYFITQNYSEKRIPRPPNAFMLFGQKYRRTVAQQYPSYTNKQISKILGDKWRKMDPAEKDSYHCLANEAHANHMKKYPGK